MAGGPILIKRIDRWLLRGLAALWVAIPGSTNGRTEWLQKKRKRSSRERVIQKAVTASMKSERKISLVQSSRLSDLLAFGAKRCNLFGRGAA